MTSPQARKGSAWELALLRFFREEGLTAYKPRQEGFRDVGDIAVSPFIVQAKNYRDIAAGLREGLNGAVVQAQNAGEPFGVAAVKRARKSTGDGYAVMRVSDLARLIARVREGDEAAAVLRRLTEQR